jgi:tRNA threonylcarbamoyl adenosine modification protein (Sua5/YciO/YrdC/YwlC family)
MATFYKIHPETPQRRKVEAVRDALRQGAVMLYPTDTVYAIGCDLQVKSAVQRVRQLKRLANEKPLTFLCSSLSNIADYAHVSDPAYRIIRRLIPGPYTFLLPATKQVPKLVMSPKRRSTGIRVPDNAICQSLLSALGNPVVSTSALSLMTEDGGTPRRPTFSKAELFDRVVPQVDVVIDDDRDLAYGLSTILDFSDEDMDAPTLVRPGLGWQAVADLGVVDPDGALV